MKFEQNLRCPKDKDVILYTEDREKIDGAIPSPSPAYIPETPQQCPKCGISYYQWECVPYYEVEGK